MLGDSTWHVYLPHLQRHVLMKVLLCGPLCAATQYSKLLPFGDWCMRIILFCLYPFGRKVPFFSSSSHMEGLTRNVTQIGLEKRGWEPSEGLKCSQHIFAPKIFTWLEDDFLFFFGGQVRPILRGEMAVSFSFTFCR